jgi:hypothetical protein
MKRSYETARMKSKYLEERRGEVRENNKKAPVANKKPLNNNGKGGEKHNE